MFAIAACLCASAGAAKITDRDSAISVAKNYTKAQCTNETPCKYKARRQGQQWNVWVEFTKRAAPKGIGRRALSRQMERLV